MTATPRPWPEPEYDNETAPQDEGFWEYWEIANVGTFNREDDARFAVRAVNAYDQLVSQQKDCPHIETVTSRDLRGTSRVMLTRVASAGVECEVCRKLRAFDELLSSCKEALRVLSSICGPTRDEERVACRLAEVIEMVGK